MNFADIDEDTKWYVGSQLDGDGCCWATESLHVNLPKSIKSATTVLRFQKLFGGSVYWRLGRGNREAQCEWRIGGQEAIEFCNMIKDYTELKRRQFTLAATFPMSSAPLQVSKDGKTWMVSSLAEAGELVKRRGDYLGKTLRNNGPYTKDGYTISKVTDVKKLKGDIKSQISQLNHTEHLAITRELPFAYLAGFADAELCITMDNSKRFILSIPQAHVAITNAYKAKFDYGVVSQNNRGQWLWTTCGQDTRDTLNALLPFLFEKRAQAEISLSATGRSWFAKKRLLDKMKAVNHAQGRFASVTTEAELQACRSAAEQAIDRMEVLVDKNREPIDYDDDGEEVEYEDDGEDEEEDEEDEEEDEEDDDDE